MSMATHKTKKQAQSKLADKFSEAPKRPGWKLPSWLLLLETRNSNTTTLDMQVQARCELRSLLRKRGVTVTPDIDEYLTSQICPGCDYLIGKT